MEKFIKENKKQKYLIIVFALIIIVIIFVWWFGFYNKGKTVSPASSSQTILKEIKIDFELFKSSEFKMLQSFKEIIPFKGKKGKQNPFLP